MACTGVRFPLPTVSSSNQRRPRVTRQPLVQSGGECLRAFPSTPGEGKDKTRWRAVVEKGSPHKEEKERKPRLACWRLVWSVPVLAVRVCLTWCGLIKEAVSGSIAGRLVISHSSAFVLAGVRRSFPGPWSLVLRCWRWVRVPPPDKLDQTARGGQVQE